MTPASRFSASSILTSSFLSSCGMLVSYLCLGWGAYRLWQGRIDFGTMVLFLQLASYLSSSLSALIHLVPSAIEASVSARRIMSVLELPRERLDHSGARTAARPRGRLRWRCRCRGWSFPIRAARPF